jgi:hypothetical protein
MTTQPPAPSYVPTGPGQPRKTGTVALVFGILLCVIALPFAIRFLSLLLLSMVRADAYIFGMSIGALIGVALFGLPGIVLIRRFTRIRRENRAADATAAAAYGYPAAPAYDAPVAQETPPVPSAPAAATTPEFSDAGPQQPPVPPADPNAPRPDPEFPSVPPIAPPR